MLVNGKIVPTPRGQYDLWNRKHLAIHSVNRYSPATLVCLVGGGSGTPLQYSCLEHPMGGGAWWAAVHGVAKSRTWLTERLHFYISLSCIGEGNGNPLQCSCLENPRAGGAWWAAVWGVAQSGTRLKRCSSRSSSVPGIVLGAGFPIAHKRGRLCFEVYIVVDREGQLASIYIKQWEELWREIKHSEGREKDGARSFFFFSFIFISWRLITLQYCSGFCNTLTWISHGYTCVPHPDLPSHLPLHRIPLGLPSAPGPSTCLMHPAWAGALLNMVNVSLFDKRTFE